VTPLLRVNRPELEDALKKARKFLKPKDRSEAVFSFDQGSLRVQMVGMTFTATAEGVWPGQARVPIASMGIFLSGIPGADWIEVRIHGDRLGISTLSVPCAWDPIPTQAIQLPLDPSLLMILQLSLAHSREHIAASGLEKVLEGAEKRRDELVEKAAELLRDLAVSPSDLLDMVDGCIARSATGKRKE